MIERLGNPVKEFVAIVGDAIGQVGVLGLIPHGFHRIEVRSIGRKPFHLQPACSLFLKLSHGRAMHAVAITDQDDRALGLLA